MAICKLMIFDFMDGTGRFEDDIELYTDSDLTEGIAFADWMKEEGRTKWPHYDFSVEKFKEWALKQLKEGGGKR
jgi:hypothetical protein